MWDIQISQVMEHSSCCPKAMRSPLQASDKYG